MAGVLVIFLPDESRPKFVCPAIVATGMHRASGWGCFLGCPPPSPPLPQGPSGPQWVKGTIPTPQDPMVTAVTQAVVLWSSMTIYGAPRVKLWSWDAWDILGPR